MQAHGAQRSSHFPVAIRYDNGLLEVEGEVNFRLTDHAIPIPRSLRLAPDDQMAIACRIVEGEGDGPGRGRQERGE